MIEPGRQLGNYVILQQLGQGGMGEVYLAQHRRISRLAAVKVLLPELSQHAETIDRFFTEARATSLIRHPNIVEIIDCDVFEGRAFIVMEYLEGESLAGYLRRVGPLAHDLDLAFGVALAVTSGLAAAHARGIIHRDLKPDNIFLHLGGIDDTPTAKILDFGIAKLAQHDNSRKTHTGVLLGTPAYMSPEQCRGAGQIDGRSDVYSLGCILYEMLSGRPPFVREGLGELIVAHISEAADPPSAFMPLLDPALDRLVAQLLAKRPDDRPADMDQVSARLRACAQSLGRQAPATLRPNVPVLRPASVAFQHTLSTPVATPIAGGGMTPHGRTPNPMTPQPSTAGPPHDSAGGTRKLPSLAGLPGSVGPVAVTGAHDRPAGASRWRGWLLATALAAGAGLGLWFFRRPEPGPGPQTAAQVSPAQSASPPSDRADPKRDQAPTPQAAVARDDDFVTVEVSGIPVGTSAVLDGQPTALPARVRRGSDHHRLVLRTPDGRERTLTVDATRDRLIDLDLGGVAPGRQGGSPAASPGSGSQRAGAGHRGSDRNDPPRSTRKAAGTRTGRSDRDPIMDL